MPTYFATVLRSCRRVNFAARRSNANDMTHVIQCDVILEIKGGDKHTLSDAIQVAIILCLNISLPAGNDYLAKPPRRRPHLFAVGDTDWREISRPDFVVYPILSKTHPPFYHFPGDWSNVFFLLTAKYRIVFVCVSLALCHNLPARVLPRSRFRPQRWRTCTRLGNWAVRSRFVCAAFPSPFPSSEKHLL